MAKHCLHFCLGSFSTDGWKTLYNQIFGNLTLQIHSWYPSILCDKVWQFTPHHQTKHMQLWYNFLFFIFSLQPTHACNQTQNLSFLVGSSHYSKHYNIKLCIWSHPVLHYFILCYFILCHLTLGVFFIYLILRYVYLLYFNLL